MFRLSSRMDSVGSRICSRRVLSLAASCFAIGLTENNSLTSSVICCVGEKMYLALCHGSRRVQKAPSLSHRHATRSVRFRGCPFFAIQLVLSPEVALNRKFRSRGCASSDSNPETIEGRASFFVSARRGQKQAIDPASAKGRHAAGRYPPRRLCHPRTARSSRQGSGRGFNSAKTSSGKPSKRPSQRDTNSLGIFGK